MKGCILDMLRELKVSPSIQKILFTNLYSVSQAWYKDNSSFLASWYSAMVESYWIFLTHLSCSKGFLIINDQ